MNGTTAYPLCWPTGRKRTPSYQIQASRFEVSSFAVVRGSNEAMARINRAYEQFKQERGI